MPIDLNEALKHQVQLGRDLSAAEIERKTQMVVVQHEGRSYFKGDFGPLRDPEPPMFKVFTLTAVADYLNKNPDEIVLENTIVHVVDATTVAIVSKPHGAWKQRTEYLRADALVPDHNFDRFVAPDVFVPYLQSCFCEGGDLATVLKIAGNITASSELRVEDDGVSQTVAAKVGIVKKCELDVPNPVVLYPFSSFSEIAQPPRKFVLRLKGSADTGIACSLIEADGGVWQIAAIDDIAKWLREKLPQGVRVIA